MGSHPGPSFCTLSVNVDAELVKKSGAKLSQVEEKMVEMSNGEEVAAACPAPPLSPVQNFRWWWCCVCGMMRIQRTEDLFESGFSWCSLGGIASPREQVLLLPLWRE